MERDNTIDIIRFCALFFIIMAHVKAPQVIINVRSFEVPLIIFVSGLAMSGKTIASYTYFVKSRTLRLLLPVYMFIIPFMVALYLAGVIGIFPPYLTKDMATSTLLLQEGIGYVWIFKVFLFITFLTPCMQYFTLKVNRDIYFLCIIISIVALQEILTSCTPKDNTVYTIYQYYIVYIITYAPLFMLGIRLRNTSCHDYIGKKWLIVACIILTVTGIHYYIQNQFSIPLSPNYKYPPQAYYILYGMAISIILWEIRFLIKIDRWPQVFAFVGQNTMWIYLWHIPFVIAANHFSDNWILKFFIITLASTTVYTIQYRIIKSTSNRFLNKYLIG